MGQPVGYDTPPPARGEATIGIWLRRGTGHADDIGGGLGENVFGPGGTVVWGTKDLTVASPIARLHSYGPRFALTQRRQRP